jgi:excisionase family DNA binding protein
MTTHLLDQRIEAIHKLIAQQTLANKEHMSLEETATYMGVSKSFLYKLTSQRKIPFYRPGSKLIFFKKSEIDIFLLSNRQNTKTEIESHIGDQFIRRGRTSK